MAAPRRSLRGSGSRGCGWPAGSATAVTRSTTSNPRSRSSSGSGATSRSRNRSRNGWWWPYSSPSVARSRPGAGRAAAADQRAPSQRGPTRSRAKRSASAVARGIEGDGAGEVARRRSATDDASPSPTSTRYGRRVSTAGSSACHGARIVASMPGVGEDPQRREVDGGLRQPHRPRPAAEPRARSRGCPSAISVRRSWATASGRIAWWNGLGDRRCRRPRGRTPRSPRAPRAPRPRDSR